MNDLKTKLLGVVLLIVGVLLAVIGFYPRQSQTVLSSSQSAQPSPSQAVDSGHVKTTTKKIEIPANRQWVDTGFDVTGPIRISFVSGQWTNGGKPLVWCDAKGLHPSDDYNELSPRLTVPGAWLGQLVGKTKDKTFSVGALYEGQPPQGRLYLGMNDVNGEFDDNKGSVIVTITSR